MSKETVAAADSSCKYCKGVECNERKCSKCGFNPAVQKKRVNRLRYERGADVERLIDATALSRKQFGAMGWLSGLDLAAAPTIDAVRVIRCKDCVHCKENNMFGRQLILECKETCLAVSADDYCSRAKRRAGNG